MATQSLPSLRLVPTNISSNTLLNHRMTGARQIDTKEGLQKALERRNRRKRETLQHAANIVTHEVKAKSSTTVNPKSTEPKQKRPIFQRSKIIDPLIVARNNTSMVSIESATSAETIVDDVDEEHWTHIEESIATRTTTTTIIVEGERKVRFCVDEKGDILPDYLPSKGPRWFQKPAIEGTVSITQDEFRLIIEDARSYVRLIRNECPEIVTILLNMFEDKGLADGLLSDKDAGILKLWSSSHGRGLEDHLMAEVKLHRNNARTRILKFQEKMASIGCRDFAQALRDRSCMESKQSTAFARLLAIGDALEAETIHFGKTSKQTLAKRRST